MPGAPSRTDFANHREHNILSGYTRTHLIVDDDAHVTGFLLNQALRRQHVFDLGGADTESQGTKGTVRGGVRVTTHHSHAGQGGALLGADDVHNALAKIVHIELSNAVLLAVTVQGLDLYA